jgi:hypothetical protein
MPKPKFCHGLIGISGRLRGDNLEILHNKETDTYTVRIPAKFKKEIRHKSFGIKSTNIKNI